MPAAPDLVGRISLAGLPSRLIQQLLLFIRHSTGARMPGGKSGCCLCAFRRERAAVRLDIGCRSFRVLPTKWLSMRCGAHLRRAEVNARMFGWQYLCALFLAFRASPAMRQIGTFVVVELPFSAIRHNQTAIRQLLTLHQLQINLVRHFVEQRNTRTEQDGMDVEPDFVDQPRFE